MLINRTDIPANYKVETRANGEYLYSGLPIGMYTIILTIDGREVSKRENMRVSTASRTEVNFNLADIVAEQKAMQTLMQGGQLTEDQAKSLTPEQRAALEEQMKARAADIAKNKELNDAFQSGLAAVSSQNYAAAVEHFTKASTLDPKQEAVWSNLGETYKMFAKTKTGAERDELLNKSMEAFGKAMELKPEDPGVHNNFALALAEAKRFKEAEDELTKAAALDPANAAMYFFNLGAVLTNIGQSEEAGAAFKKAIDANPEHANAQYQYGIYLIGKATTTPDGQVVPPAGAKEAFEKYLALQPNGPYADGARGILATLGATISTEYENPDRAKGKAATKKK